MAPLADIVSARKDVDTSMDSVVIRHVMESIDGGRTLDVTEFKKEVIKAGHVVIRETSSGKYKPMPLTPEGTGYAELPEGHTYAGIVIGSIKKDKPFCAIMVRGTVNVAAAPFKMNTILEAVKTALPLIRFKQD